MPDSLKSIRSTIKEFNLLCVSFSSLPLIQCQPVFSSNLAAKERTRGSPSSAQTMRNSKNISSCARLHSCYALPCAPSSFSSSFRYRAFSQSLVATSSYHESRPTATLGVTRVTPWQLSIASHSVLHRTYCAVKEGRENFLSFLGSHR